MPCLLELQLEMKSALYSCAQRKWGDRVRQEAYLVTGPVPGIARAGPQRAEPATLGGTAHCISKHEDLCHRAAFLLRCWFSRVTIVSRERTGGMAPQLLSSASAVPRGDGAHSRVFVLFLAEWRWPPAPKRRAL